MDYTKRAKIKLKTPNPLFERWIKEWLTEAANSNNFLKINTFQNALDSLKKYPLVLKNGKECMILDHFDTSLCVLLDRKLADYRKESTGGNVIGCTSESSTEAVIQRESKKSKKLQERKKIGDCPRYRSAAYALMLTLYRNESTEGYKGYMTKLELQNEAQRLCDTSLKKAQSGSFYTGWTSMSHLINKGLVNKTNNPARYSLSNTGREVARRIEETEPSSCGQASFELAPPSVGVSELTSITAPVSLRGKKGVSNLRVEEESEEILTQDTDDVEEAVLSPGTFDTVLLVDTAEINSTNQCDDVTISELKATGIHFEVRHLKVGDFMWICKSRTSTHELVLPFIVERKRLDDLAKSIIDGRFHEQKFRLKRCGVYNMIYLIENIGKQKFGLPLSSLNQAVINTMVADEFTVKLTQNHSESIKYLAFITTTLTNMFRKKVLFSCKESEWSLDIMDDTAFLLPFKTFISGMGKTRNFKVKEMFVKLLVQLHGMSADKAWAVASNYPTPAALISALNSSSMSAELLSNIQYGVLNRRIGPALSAQLHQFYTRPCFE